MKETRQDAILRIIGESDIETQRELIAALRGAGYDATQATVSRDIKDLCLIKEQAPNGRSRYTTAGVSARERDYTARLRAIFREGVTECVPARNLVVLKTLPGFASVACAAIDSMGIRGFVGSVAGDDTAFLAMKDERSAERLCAEIDEILA